MKIVFRAREDRTSSLMAVMLLGILLSEWQHISNIMLQNKALKDEMVKHLFSGDRAMAIREESSYFALEGLDYLIWQERNNKLTVESVNEVMMRVCEKSVFIPSGERDAPGLYPEETGRMQMGIIDLLDQITDLVLLDCGEVWDNLSKGLIVSGCLSVICLSQKKELIDEVMVETNIDPERTFFIITDYDHSSIYNKKNIARLYRIPEKRIGVIPKNEELKKQLGRGEICRFIRKNVNSKVGSKYYYFMKELKNCTSDLLTAVNYGA